MTHQTGILYNITSSSVIQKCTKFTVVIIQKNIQNSRSLYPLYGFSNRPIPVEGTITLSVRLRKSLYIVEK